jgi:hypothetical protein
MHQRDLAAFFDALSDEELLSRLSEDALTDEARAIAVAEANKRGFAVPDQFAPTESGPDSVYEGDLVVLEKDLSPQEAQLLAGFLQSAGIAATTGDTNTIQAHALLSIAIGGARVRVPALRLAESRELLVAFKRGDFELGDDFDASAA